MIKTNYCNYAIIINAYNSKIDSDPKNPNSSEKSVKIKSVCFSGK